VGSSSKEKAAFTRALTVARRFLLAAEYHYLFTPADMDFSGAIVLFTKAFEHSLKGALRPLEKRIQNVIKSDNAPGQKPFAKYTLGQVHGLLKAHPTELKSMLGEIGLDYDRVSSSVRQINEEAPAKHLASKSKADATRFRSLILGSSSVISALFRPEQA